MAMLWEEYYDKLGDWATSTAVSRMSALQSFGPPDEIVDAINTLGFDDQKGATRLLKKAIAAGVKFSGDQFSDLFLNCDEEVVHHAVQLSSDQFTAEDLGELYGFSDEEVLIDIAKRQNIPLPECLLGYAEAFAYDTENDVPPRPTPEELAAEYDYILDCLKNAYDLLKKAHQFGLIDTSSKARAATVVKYGCITDAQDHISNALNAWESLEIPNHTKRPLRGIRLNISNTTMWQNFLFERLFTNMAVKRQIRKVMKNIESAHYMIRKLRSSL